ncbi:tetratricopeptide repeat protein [Pontibacter vulgaris]|uniref:tetratricopeptide repeat protein n=1 Tax=Pontibacter vulgaris TaxID=2905679 RepID=UPI001FA7DEF8|nr:hypothetical protein [Pontibacter vulgaris]
MKRLLFVAVALLVTATLSFAQEQKDPKVLPMFGNQAKTEAQQLKDQKFLSSCDASFKTRQEASNFFMERGWEYFSEGQVDTAVYRFNLAWLLNPDNSNTYWAFGLVTSGKGNNAEAITYYEKALAYQPKNSMLLTDLASAYINIYKTQPKKKNLKKASVYSEQAIANDSTNSYAYYTLSQVKYHEKKYADAWAYVHKSRGINLAQIDYDFVTELLAKMPDPQGFFKAD